MDIKNIYVFNITLGPYIHLAAIFKELKIEGFIVTRYTSRYPEALKEMKQWISEV